MNLNSGISKAAGGDHRGQKFFKTARGIDSSNDLQLIGTKHVVQFPKLYSHQVAEQESKDG